MSTFLEKLAGVSSYAGQPSSFLMKLADSGPVSRPAVPAPAPRLAPEAPANFRTRLLRSGGFSPDEAGEKALVDLAESRKIAPIALLNQRGLERALGAAKIPKGVGEPSGIADTWNRGGGLRGILGDARDTIASGANRGLAGLSSGVESGISELTDLAQDPKRLGAVAGLGALGVGAGAMALRGRSKARAAAAAAQQAAAASRASRNKMLLGGGAALGGGLGLAALMNRGGSDRK